MSSFLSLQFIKRIFSFLSSTPSQLNSTKMALIVRSDLKMSKGKTAAQCSHASVLCYQKSIDTNSKILHNWCVGGQPKIVLKIDSIEEIKDLHQNARKLQIVSEIVRDAGRTQLEPGTITVIGLGPDYTDKIDQLVKHLKLL